MHERSRIYYVREQTRKKKKRCLAESAFTSHFYTPGANLTYLAPPGQSFISAIVFIGTPPPCKKNLSPKEYWFGLCKMHGFHGNPLCTSQVWGVPKNQSYLTCYLS